MEVGNRCRLFLLIAMISFLDVAVGNTGHLTFQVMINNVKSQVLSPRTYIEDLKAGDNLTLFCDGEGVLGRIHYRTAENVRVDVISPLTMIVQECGNLGFTCISPIRYLQRTVMKQVRVLSHCPSVYVNFDLSSKSKGDHVKLKCTTGDYPVYDLIISREDTGTELNRSQSSTGMDVAEVTFDLEKITCDDMRAYMCQAIGQDGNVHSKLAELKIHDCPPMPCWNETRTFDVTVAQNQSTQLTFCFRDFSSIRSFHKFHQGKMFPYGSDGWNKTVFDLKKHSRIYITKTIQFKNVQENDYGQWLFRLSNEWGHFNVTINLRPDDYSDVNTAKRGHSTENIDDHSGVSTKMIGIGAGVAVSGLVIILLFLLIIARWRKSMTWPTAKGKRHLDPGVMSSVSYKRIHVDTVDDEQAIINDASNIQ